MEAPKGSRRYPTRKRRAPKRLVMNMDDESEKYDIERKIINHDSELIGEASEGSPYTGTSSVDEDDANSEDEISCVIECDVVVDFEKNNKNEKKSV